MDIVEQLNQRKLERVENAFKEYERIVFELAADNADLDAGMVEDVLSLVGKTANDLTDDVGKAMAVHRLVSQEALQGKHNDFIKPLKESLKTLKEKKADAEELAKQLQKDITITASKISVSHRDTQDQIIELKNAQAALAVSGLPTYAADKEKFLKTHQRVY